MKKRIPHKKFTDHFNSIDDDNRVNIEVTYQKLNYLGKKSFTIMILKVDLEKANI